MVDKETLDVLKTLVSVAGIIVSVMGLVAVVLAYFFVSPVISLGEETVLKNVDGSATIVAGVGASYDNVSAALGEVPVALDGSSTAFKSFSETEKKVAIVLNSLAGAGNASSSADAAVAGLDASSLDFENAGSAAANASAKIKVASVALKNSKLSLLKVERDLQEAKNEVKSIFGNLRSAMLLASALFALVFLVLLAYSLSNALGW
ncbi:hypothetical protein HY992_02130 [Candidatus Micrarchaeota archaeon]|nr:hypothetical protein [Candidatus Micrarchaeota archaeon]